MKVEKRLIFSLIFTIPLFVITMFHWIFPSHFLTVFPYLEFALATPVVFIAGFPIIKLFFLSLKNKSLNMFTLIGLGVLVAYFFSLIALFFPHLFPLSFHDAVTGKPKLYFEVAGIIMTLVLFGQVLELKARSKTGAAIQFLLNLVPKTATRIDSKGNEEEIPICHLKVDDLGEPQAQ